MLLPRRIIPKGGIIAIENRKCTQRARLICRQTKTLVSRGADGDRCVLFDFRGKEADGGDPEEGREGFGERVEESRPWRMMRTGLLERPYQVLSEESSESSAFAQSDAALSSRV